MKKKVLLSLVLLAIVATSAVFAQSQGRYYLEIWNISETTFNNTASRSNDPAYMREDIYYSVRIAGGTVSRSKDRNLSLEDVRQKLLSIAPRDNPWQNKVTESLQNAQQKWGAHGAGFNTNTSPQYCVYFWIRRIE